MALTIAHVSDFHVAGNPSFLLHGENTRANLAAVARSLGEHRPSLDLILVGGDVSHDGSPESYEFVEQIFADFACPFVATPGNHDDRRRLAALFPTGNDVADGLLATERAKLAVVDSQIPGAEEGRVSSIPAVADSGDSLLLVLLHHDLVQPDGGGRPGMRIPHEELSKLLTLSPPTVFLTGHRHLAMDVCIGDVRILGAPATSTQFDFEGGVPRRSSRSIPGYRTLTVEDGRLHSTRIVDVAAGSTPA
ncbi:MAG: metallophosphoesterase [Acidimicrobiia bacterium]|nr:metallophosphoesterase [Acidimicrobiia bacterium]